MLSYAEKMTISSFAIPSHLIKGIIWFSRTSPIHDFMNMNIFSNSIRLRNIKIENPLIWGIGGLMVYNSVLPL